MIVGDVPGLDVPRCPRGPVALDPEFGRDDLSGLRLAVEGAFKVPTLRNVEFTGPYMHNGGMSTLEQVMAFYNRGGDIVGPELADNIEPLDLTEEQLADLVAFLRALTDDRVLHRRAPFDHPELLVETRACSTAWLRPAFRPSVPRMKSGRWVSAWAPANTSSG